MAEPSDRTHLTGRLRWVDDLAGGGLWHVELESGTLMPAENIWYGLHGRRVSITVDVLEGKGPEQ